MEASPFSTKQRILDAAEELFASDGFAGASLRKVTSMAKVNLAAVNYHFGSKDGLVEEVFRRRLDVLSEHRLTALDTLNDEASLEDVLHAFVRPALDLAMQSRSGRDFVRILARAYAERDDQLRDFISNHYGHVLKRFAAAMAMRLPQLDKAELYWRLDIVTGALTYAMARFGVIQPQAGISVARYIEQATQHLVHFAAAGLRSS